MAAYFFLIVSIFGLSMILVLGAREYFKLRKEEKNERKRSEDFKRRYGGFNSP